MMRKYHRRATPALAAAVAGLLLLAGCSSPTDSSSPGSDEEVSFSVGALSAPTSLDYTTASGAAISQLLLYNVYEGLVKLNDDAEIVPLLAESFEVSDDGLVYDFVLQQGVTFSNGDPFTAESVKFSLVDRADVWTVSDAEFLDPVADVEAVSDHEVRITLSAPSNNWLFNMAGPIGTMFTPDGVADLATDPVGTGPFDISSFVQGTSATLTARDDYWGEKPGVNEVIFRYYADSTTQANALLSGSLDMVAKFNAYQMLSQFEGDDQFQVLQGTGNGEVTMAMNHRREAMQDLRVRQAIMYGIDKEAVLSASDNKGYGTIIGSMMMPTDPWYDASLVDMYPYDPKKSQELLEEAGYSQLDLTFVVPNQPRYVSIAQVIASQLGDVGINVTLDTQEFPAVWLEEVYTKHEFDLSIIEHSAARDATYFVREDYYPGYADPKVGELFDRADVETDEAKYLDLMQQAHRMMAEESIANWLWAEPNINVAKSAFTGIPTNAPSAALDLTAVSR